MRGRGAGAVAVVVTALLVGACGASSPSSHPRTSSASATAAYVDQIHRDAPDSRRVDAATLIALAETTCADLSGGRRMAQVVDDVHHRTVSLKLSSSFVGTLLIVAPYHLCPRYSKTVADWMDGGGSPDNPCGTSPACLGQGDGDDSS